jgi:hypothetical protein
MQNELSLRFGPAIPNDLEALPIAFIGASGVSPGDAVSILSSESYSADNRDGVRRYEIPDVDSKVGSVRVRLYTPGNTVSNTGELVRDRLGSMGFELVNSRVSALGVETSPAGTWLPVISSGCYYSYRKLGTVDFEQSIPYSQQSSWIARAGLRPGDNVILCYSIPEALYGHRQWSVQSAFPGSGVLVVRRTETVDLIGPNRFRYRGDVQAITKMWVDGRYVAGTLYTGDAYNTVFRELDRASKTVTVRRSFTPDTEIEIEYLSFPTTYRYSGYRDWQGTWYRFDCNPEYGRTIDFRRGNTKVTTSVSDALKNQVSVYLIPSACMKIDVTNADGYDQPEVTITCYSAFDYGETHFVRHHVGSPTEVVYQDPKGAFGASNQYNYAVFGRNEYDEDVTFGDSFLREVPLAVPIMKMFATQPTLDETVSVADLRVRGGGVPERVALDRANLEDSGIDVLRGFFDIGVWNGAVSKEGGSVEVKIDSRALDRFTAQEIYEIVRSRMLPGIDFTITYV